MSQTHYICRSFLLFGLTLSGVVLLGGCSTGLNLDDLLEDLNLNNEETSSDGIQIDLEVRFMVVNDNFLEEVGVNIELLGEVSGNASNTQLGDEHTGSPAVSSTGLVLGGHVQTSYIYQDNLSPLLIPSFDARMNPNDVVVIPEYKHIEDKLDEYDDDLITGFNKENIPSTVINETSVEAEAQGQLTELHGTLLDDTEVSAIIRAAEQDDNFSITGPSVTLLNNQRAFITVRSEVGESDDATSGFQSQIDNFVDVNFDNLLSGPVLDIIPTVSQENNITLTIFPGTQAILLDWPTTITLDDGTEITIILPLINPASVTTTVSVPDGGTVLMGGLKFSDREEVQTGLPILNKIPYVNRLFKNEALISDERTLLLMVTPRILIQEEEEVR